MKNDIGLILKEYNRVVNDNNRLRNAYNKLKESSILLDTLLKKIENVHDMKLIADHIRNVMVKYTGSTHLSIFIKTKKNGLTLKSTSISRVQSRPMNDKTFLNILESIKEIIVLDTNKEVFLSNRDIQIKTTLVVPCVSRQGEIIAYILFESDKLNYFDNLEEVSFDVLSRIVTMIIEIILTYDALKEKMYTDPMLNAYTREYMNVLIDEFLIERGKVKTDFIMTMFDIDLFKSVNDTYGHLTGDQVLKNVVNYVKTMIRVDDYIIRLGGDEFLILHMNTRDGKTIFDKVVNIRDGLSKIKMVSEDGKEFNVTGSFGVLNPFMVKQPIIFNDLYKIVDDMLYKSKKSGRNLVSYYKGIDKNTVTEDTVAKDDDRLNIIFDQK